MRLISPSVSSFVYTVTAAAAAPQAPEAMRFTKMFVSTPAAAATARRALPGAAALQPARRRGPAHLRQEGAAGPVRRDPGRGPAGAHPRREIQRDPVKAGRSRRGFGETGFRCGGG